MHRLEPSPNQWLSEGIKEVLDLQYRLHEVGHHRLAKAADIEGTGPKIVEPVAHHVSDIYKCLHQGTFGVGHSIDSPQGFKRRLFDEMMRTQTALAEPLLERVSADGSVIRVNLRPFRALFLGSEESGCDLLVKVCLESAPIVTGTPAGFFCALDLFRDLNKSGELISEGMIISIPEQTVEGFLREIRQLTADSGFIPVLSHSPVYRKLNNPSYRVVHLNALMRSPLATLIQSPHDNESKYVH
ncbi:hypothetical protein SBDP1_1150011 [Syntrophobacter sp. SbD1]|nr:hypothetical protein SBDP1_1150011 [Syntrophobacter sp. SbD1]